MGNCTKGKGSCINEHPCLILVLRMLEKWGKVVKMTSKVNLGKWEKGERVVFHFYLVLVLFVNSPSSSISPFHGKVEGQEINLGKMLH
jgi:hypothetical protein